MAVVKVSVGACVFIFFGTHDHTPRAGAMLPLTTYGGEMRHLRQGTVHRFFGEPLTPEDQETLASEPSFDEGAAQRRHQAHARVLGVPVREQGHKSRLSRDSHTAAPPVYSRP